MALRILPLLITMECDQEYVRHHAVDYADDAEHATQKRVSIYSGRDSDRSSRSPDIQSILVQRESQCLCGQIQFIEICKRC